MFGGLPPLRVCCVVGGDFARALGVSIHFFCFEECDLVREGDCVAAHYCKSSCFCFCVFAFCNIFCNMCFWFAGMNAAFLKRLRFVFRGAQCTLLLVLGPGDLPVLLLLLSLHYKASFNTVVPRAVVGPNCSNEHLVSSRLLPLLVPASHAHPPRTGTRTRTRPATHHRRSRGWSATRASAGYTKSARFSTAARTRTSTPVTTVPTAS